MNRKTILGVPTGCFWGVVSVCIFGIIVGSIRDFEINVALANKTNLGTFFATYGSYFSYCLYPAAGACLYVGLKANGDRFHTLAWVLLLVVERKPRNQAPQSSPGCNSGMMSITLMSAIS